MAKFLKVGESGEMTCYQCGTTFILGLISSQTYPEDLSLVFGNGKLVINCPFCKQDEGKQQTEEESRDACL